MVTLGSIEPGMHPRRRAALAAHTLRVALSNMGLLELFPECAADVHGDRAVVHLGTVDADAALALAERLRSSKRGRHTHSGEHGRRRKRVGRGEAAMTQETDTYPLWTIRFTWSILNSADQPTYTYMSAASETEAIDRAAFALDRYDNSGERVLVAVHVKRPDDWSDVPKSSTRIAQHGYLYAFQRPPTRPR